MSPEGAISLRLALSSTASDAVHTDYSRLLGWRIQLLIAIKIPKDMFRHDIESTRSDVLIMIHANQTDAAGSARQGSWGWLLL
jgi:hypothetical protein